MIFYNTEYNECFLTRVIIEISLPGAHYKEPAIPIISHCNGGNDIFTDQSIFRYFFPAK